MATEMGGGAQLTAVKRRPGKVRAVADFYAATAGATKQQTAEGESGRNEFYAHLVYGR